MKRLTLIALLSLCMITKGWADEVNVATFSDLLTAITGTPTNGTQRTILVSTNINLGAGAGTGGTIVIATGQNILIKSKGTTPYTLSRSSSVSSNAMQIEAGATLAFENITVDGKDINGIAGSFLYNKASTSTLNLGTGVTIKNFKKSNGYGTVAHNEGKMTINGATITANKATHEQYSLGGAIYNSSTAVLTISNSTFTSNSSTSAGGAILNDCGVMNISNSSFQENTAPRGSAIFSKWGQLKVGPDTKIGTGASTDNGLCLEKKSNTDVLLVVSIDGMAGSMINIEAVEGTGITLPTPIASQEGTADITAAMQNFRVPNGNNLSMKDNKIYMGQTGSGFVGNISWTVASKTIMFSGTGAMPDYEAAAQAPWYQDATLAAVNTAIIGEGITHVGANNFLEYRSIRTLGLPASLESIGKQAFKSCSGLSTVTLAASSRLTTIGEAAFGTCVSLSSFALPASLRTLGDYAFSSTGLTEMVLPEGLTSVGSYALSACNSLQKLTLPASLTTYGSMAFGENIALTEVTINAATPPVISEIVFFGSDLSKTTLNVPDGSEELYRKANIWNTFSNMAPASNIEHKFEGGVLTIWATSGEGPMDDYDTAIAPNYAPWLANAAAITSVVIEEGITTVGKNSFVSCLNLTSVSLPSTITAIGEYAFYNCEKLASITLPDALTTIGKEAFMGCAFTELTLPKLTTTIGADAFKGCIKLASLTMLASTPSENIDPAAFDSNYIANCTLYVPYANTNNYKGRGDIWEQFKSIVGFASGTTDTLSWLYLDTRVLTISGEGAMPDYDSPMVAPWFVYRAGIKNIVIESGVTTIGSNAFRGFTDLETVTAHPATAPVANATAFDGVDLKACELVLSAEVGSSYMNADVWKDFGSLTVNGTAGDLEWTLTGGTLTIAGKENMPGYTSFAETPWAAYADNITALAISGAVKSVGNNAFAGCDKLTSATLSAPITIIGDNAFAGCTELSAITLPTALKTIGQQAFDGCAEITAISLPASIISIGSKAFANTGLTTVTVDKETPLSIAADVFEGVNLKEATLNVPVSKKTAYEAATVWKEFGTIQEFMGGTKDNITWTVINGTLTISGTGDMPTISGLLPWSNAIASITSVVIEEGITSVSDLFTSYPALTSVSLPQSVTVIGDNAFGRSAALTTINFPDKLTTIGSQAFKECALLNPVVLPASLTEIGSRAFEACTSLESIELPEATTTLGQSVFNGCTALTSVELPTTLATINVSLFNGCTALSSITLPASVTAIEASAFEECNSLSEVIVLSSTPATLGANAFNNASANLEIRVPRLSVDTYKKDNEWKELNIVANMVTGTTGNLTWTYGDGWMAITGEGDMPNYESAKDAPWHAYADKLTSVEIGEDVTTIGNNAFNGCAALNSITISGTPTAIGSSAFEGCSSLTSFVIAETVTSIGEKAFAGCTALANLTAWNTTPVAINANVFEGVDAANCELTVWKSAAAAYGDADVWEEFDIKGYTIGGTIGALTWELENGTLTISGDGVIPDYNQGAPWYQHAASITNIVIEEGVTSVGQMGFYMCSYATSVSIPTSLESIGAYAFAACMSLSSITIPAKVNSIGQMAFGMCAGLTEFVALNPAPVNITGLNVFYGIEDLTKVSLYVPTAAEAAYKVADEWKNFGSVIGFDYIVGLTSNDETRGTATGRGYYKATATVTLTATAEAGFAFVNWTVDGVELSTTNPYTFTPTKDINIVANFENATDLSADNAQDRVAIYPNPARDVLYIATDADVLNVEIIATGTGQVVMNTGAADNGIRVSELPAGSYLVKVTTTEGVWVKKMVKE